MTMGSSGAADRARQLRDGAAALLREAAVCNDAARRDALTRTALVQIDEARRLAGQAGDARPSQPTRKH